MEEEILVSVVCAAYNHEKYISDCLEGIVNQKTDFRYEVIVHDDASTDRTAEIIREYEGEYPHMIRAIYQTENQFMRCSVSRDIVYPQIRGKYVAFCDGDDYWTDMGKLQEQADFLEAHGEYSMCMHNAVKVNVETGEEKLLDTFPDNGAYPQEQQILAGLGTDFPAFSSVMGRSGLLESIPDFFFSSKVMDYPIRQYFADCGKVYYAKKPMSVYRVSTPQSYMKKTAESQRFYNNYTLEMINFFENFDRYTEGRFHHILGRKILSDYFGFCLSAAEAEGLKKASEKGLDMGKVREIYRLLSPDYLDVGIRKLQEKKSHLFIYGISRLAPVCMAQLEHAGVPFEGFVVSDSQMKAGHLEGNKVFYLSEVMARYGNPGFILAVQPVNVDAIAGLLGSFGVADFCAPYKI